MNENKGFQDFLRENPIPTECFTAREEEVARLYAYSAFLTGWILAKEDTPKLPD